ncbi:MAG TPA: FHA domain-containing protein [Patescibacteria group bacterium]|nr:FHA domain-containing protein [Patescibacteria group bacterium]
MKRLVLEITNHSGDGTITHRSIETFPATLGRGYHNDIIIGDPHVSAQHVRIEFDGNDFVIHDLGSENGLTVNAKHHKSSHAHLKSGDVVRVGHTDIRIFDPAHPVAPARRIARQNPLLAWLSRSVVVWPALLLAAVASVGWKYLDTFAYDVGETLIGTGISVIVTIMVWSALWGVAGRLARHKSRFRSHVALASLFVIAVCVAAFLQDYLSFVSNDSAPAAFAGFALNAGLVLALLYGALTLATDMTARRRRVWTFFFALGMAIAAIGMAEVNEGKFDPAPSYSAELQPYFSQLASADSPDDFLKGADKLFSSDTFQKQAKKDQ